MVCNVVLRKTSVFYMVCAIIRCAIIRCANITVRYIDNYNGLDHYHHFYFFHSEYLNDQLILS